MAAASPSSSMVPDSDPREYRPPPPHEFEPVGLKFYKPKRNTFDSGLVLQEPEIHFSGKDREGEDAATFLEEGGDYEEYRVKRLMPTFGARLPSQRPRARAVPTATGGEGAEVLGVASLEELPQLPEQVIYFSRRGQLRSDDIPSPDHVELALPPSVQQVSRDYVEACFCCISGLSALVRKKSMVIEDLEARLSVTEDQRVASAGHSASAPRGERSSTMGHGSGDNDRDEEDNDEEEEDDEEDIVGAKIRRKARRSQRRRTES